MGKNTIHWNLIKMKIISRISFKFSTQIVWNASEIDQCQKSEIEIDFLSKKKKVFKVFFWELILRRERAPFLISSSSSSIPTKDVRSLWWDYCSGALHLFSRWSRNRGLTGMQQIKGNNRDEKTGLTFSLELNEQTMK